MRRAASRSLHIGFSRLTCQPSPRDYHDALFVQRDRGATPSTTSTSRPPGREISRSTSEAKVSRPGPVRERARRGAPRLGRARATDLDIGVVEIGPHVEVVDATEADEGGPDRPVVRREAHGRHLASRSSPEAAHLGADRLGAAGGADGSPRGDRRPRGVVALSYC